LLQQDVPLPRVQTNQHMFKVMVHMAKRKHDVQMLMWILNLERSVVIHKEQSLRALVKMATWIKDRSKALSPSGRAATIDSAITKNTGLLRTMDRHIQSLQKNIASLLEHLESLGHSMLTTVPSKASETPEGSVARSVLAAERRRKHKVTMVPVPESLPQPPIERRSLDRR